MTNLLLDDRPILVMPKLAEEVGLNEAIVLQQIHYWLQRSTNIVDDHKWVYNSFPEWNKQFPWWGIATVKRTFSKLENEGYLITANYNKAGFDKTKWYRINYDRLHMIRRSDQFDTTMGSKRSDGADQFDATNTIDYTETTTEIDDDDGEINPIGKIVTLWQENFGMPNSIIITDLQEDLKDWGYDLLNYAIHRMLESGATYNSPYKYLNRILANYRNYGITTVAKAKQADEKRDAELATKANSYGKTKPVRPSQRLAKPDRPKDNRPKVSTMYKALTIGYEEPEEVARQHINEMLARGELINDGWNG